MNLKNQRIGFHLANLSGSITTFSEYVTPLRILATFKNRLQEERENESVIDLTYLFGYSEIVPIVAPDIRLHKHKATSLDAVNSSLQKEGDSEARK